MRFNVLLVFGLFFYIARSVTNLHLPAADEPLTTTMLIQSLTALGLPTILVVAACYVIIQQIRHSNASSLLQERIKQLEARLREATRPVNTSDLRDLMREVGITEPDDKTPDD